MLVRLTVKFQSTQPKRAATKCPLHTSVTHNDFNPRSPRGLRPGNFRPVCICLDFNPRSPRGLRLLLHYISKFTLRFQSTQPKRAATKLLLTKGVIWLFQSTQPKRAATNYPLEILNAMQISIHAAQEGCDPSFSAETK